MSDTIRATGHHVVEEKIGQLLLFGGRARPRGYTTVLLTRACFEEFHVECGAARRNVYLPDAPPEQ